MIIPPEDTVAEPEPFRSDDTVLLPVEEPCFVLPPEEGEALEDVGFASDTVPPFTTVAPVPELLDDGCAEEEAEALPLTTVAPELTVVPEDCEVSSAMFSVLAVGCYG